MVDLGILIRPWVKKFVASVALNGVPIRYPRISTTTGNWEFFDPIGNVYVDTGEHAQGESPEFRVENNTLQIKFPSDSDWTDLYEFSGGNAVQTEMGGGITVTNALGGWKNGDNIDPADNVFEVLKRLLNPVVPPTYTQPVLSLAGSAPLEREIGEIISPTLTPTWNQNDGGELTQYRLSKGGIVMYSGPAAVARTDAQFQLTASVTYQATADHGQGPIKNDSDGNPHADGRIAAGTKTSGQAVYTPRRRYFFGFLETMDTPDTSVRIRGLAQSALNAQVGTIMSVYIPPGGRGCCFAYPASLKAPASILHQRLNMNVMSGFTHILVDVEGANGFAPESYRVYYDQPEFPYGGEGETFILTI